MEIKREQIYTIIFAVIVVIGGAYFLFCGGRCDDNPNGNGATIGGIGQHIDAGIQQQSNAIGNIESAGSGINSASGTINEVQAGLNASIESANTSAARARRGQEIINDSQRQLEQGKRIINDLRATSQGGTKTP